MYNWEQSKTVRSIAVSENLSCLRIGNHYLKILTDASTRMRLSLAMPSVGTVIDTTVWFPMYSTNVRFKRSGLCKNCTSGERVFYSSQWYLYGTCTIESNRKHCAQKLFSENLSCLSSKNHYLKNPNWRVNTNETNLVYAFRWDSRRYDWLIFKVQMHYLGEAMVERTVQSSTKITEVE